ncbi:MEDS domain-containing protein [Pseudonocardia nigra]|uniref:MEDS domain-containing protein n=1 Tax=Pseudonocardia nigra TaxID=1921578 RepID=UPI001C6077E0|nr:MEDS domain-containing protein [Pseudonocardia nigra]
MRTAGSVADVRGYGPHDHLCLAYDDAAEFRDSALRFLADGLARGQRVQYVAGRASADLAAEIDGLAAGRPGAVHVRSLLNTYRTDAVVEPAVQVQAYAALTEEALADGFTGLRVAADATPLVRDPDRLDAFARYEHLVDRYMVTAPFSAMCAYDRTALGPEVVAQVACMHPSAGAGVTPFRLYASGHAAAALDGELDIHTRDRFASALERAALAPSGGELVLDATGLTFVDHRTVLALAELARRLGATVVLRTALGTVRRLVTLLDVEGVRVEQPE